jgi:transcriptional regulator with XRE-family HTH domain
MTRLGDLAAQREVMGVTTAELSQLLGVRQRTVQRYLAGDVDIQPAEARLAFLLAECPGVRAFLSAALPIMQADAEESGDPRQLALFPVEP